MARDKFSFEMGKCSHDSDEGNGFHMLWHQLVGELLDGKTLDEFVAARLG